MNRPSTAGLSAGSVRTARKRRVAARPLAFQVLMCALALLAIFPIYSMVATSFEGSADIAGSGIPYPHPYGGNYQAVMQGVNLSQTVGNSVLIVCCTEALVVLFGSMLGYVVGRARRGPFQWLYLWFLTGLIIPFQATMVPLFRLQILLHLSNTRAFIILYYVGGAMPFAMLLYAGFMKGIPRELEEAATVDGCGPLRLFWSIVFPLLMPATGTLVVVTVFGYWNDFMAPLLFLQDTSKYTLITQIFNFEQEHTADFGPIFAICTLAMVPIMLFFLFTQKYLIRGLTQGALKG